MQLSEFIEKYNIKISSQYADINPNMNDSKNMDNWKTTLKFNNHQYTFYFSQGFGYKGQEPTLETVLVSFLSDSRYNEYDLDEFINELGYNECDGEKIYNNIVKQDKKLQKLFGYDVYQEFIKCEE